LAFDFLGRAGEAVGGDAEVGRAGLGRVGRSGRILFHAREIRGKSRKQKAERGRERREGREQRAEGGNCRGWLSTNPVIGMLSGEILAVVSAG
jgi:hypothetical protein